jgi:hypothetical protein
MTHGIALPCIVLLCTNQLWRLLSNGGERVSIDELVYKLATALAQPIREKYSSSEEVVTAYLARLESVNPALNSVVHVNPEAYAHARCAARDAGRLAAGVQLCADVQPHYVGLWWYALARDKIVCRSVRKFCHHWREDLALRTAQPIETALVWMASSAALRVRAHNA